MKPIKDKVLELAENDDRIRAVLLNGSKVKPDDYQDFDLMFIVRDMDSLLNNRNWFTRFGEPALQQFPDDMNLGRDEHLIKVFYTFLSLFEDGSRIDLTLFPIEKFNTHYQTDSLTIVWLDKDQLFAQIPTSSDKDYYIKRPTQQEFSEVSNEFWWTITNVAKGLKRKELFFAKEHLENVVRPMFLQMIYWNIGFNFDFRVSVGKSGKFIKGFLEEKLYKEILKTYADATIESNWEALFLMTKIFEELQIKLAESLGFDMNKDEAENSIKYLERIFKD